MEMENILSGIDASGMYIDDVGSFQSSWECHIKLLSTVLWHLNENGLTTNPLKFLKC
jgi:hypothetical protein